ncbi:P-type ATPase [Fibrella rubiginis]|uniref:P-type ATPase n=1 Tax=Fibrella rubiginis TaxID=2817060 RepID=UPI001E42D706|nr:cation-transporting P-type ATPase [Fibrella rubiginis]
MMQTATPPLSGLSPDAVTQSRATHGPNVLTATAGSGVWGTLKEVVTEPMFLLLLVACALYIGLGQTAEAITLGVALLLVSGISVYQSIRSNRALDALREQTQPMTQVRRAGTLTAIPVEAVVVGDVVLVSEGERLPADGTLTDTTDFSVDEAILTGESVAVTKQPGDAVFAGTSTASGSAWLTVTAVGGQTELGNIGRSIGSISTEKTPLQVQISRFVVRMAWIGVGAFALVFGINYARSGD